VRQQEQNRSRSHGDENDWEETHNELKEDYSQECPPRRWREEDERPQDGAEVERQEASAQDGSKKAGAQDGQEWCAQACGAKDCGAQGACPQTGSRRQARRRFSHAETGSASSRGTKASARHAPGTSAASSAAVTRSREQWRSTDFDPIRRRALPTGSTPAVDSGNDTGIGCKPEPAALPAVLGKGRRRSLGTEWRAGFVPALRSGTLDEDDEQSSLLRAEIRPLHGSARDVMSARLDEARPVIP
jgi:hypothetical protein